MKITVGGRELIASTSLLVPEGEDAWICFSADEWEVKLNVKFIDNKEDPTQTFTFDGKDDHGVLTFQNWNQTLPGAAQKPFILGETNGRKVSFLFSGSAVQDIKLINLFFFWEKANGQ